MAVATLAGLQGISTTNPALAKVHTRLLGQIIPEANRR